MRPRHRPHGVGNIGGACAGGAGRGVEHFSGPRTAPLHYLAAHHWARFLTDFAMNRKAFGSWRGLSKTWLNGEQPNHEETPFHDRAMTLILILLCIVHSFFDC